MSWNVWWWVRRGNSLAYKRLHIQPPNYLTLVLKI